MPETPNTEEIQHETTSAVVDDMLQQTQQALASGQRVAAEMHELKRRADEAMDWRKQFARSPWLGVGLAVATFALVFLLFRRKS
ncbi:MAG TPA: hypothetical protein VH640_09700 [Bryobacteraceae bacterium]